VYADNVALPVDTSAVVAAAAADCRPTSCATFDQYLLPGSQQQTCSSGVLQSD